MRTQMAYQSEKTNIKNDATMRLSELMATKMCHDLCGPIGGINNGIELFQESPAGEMRDQSMDLVQLSAKEALARLTFFRRAFGEALLGHEMEWDDLTQIATDFFMTKKLQFSWHKDELLRHLPASDSKILLNTLLVISDMLIYGGKISVDYRQKESGTVIKVKGESQSVKVQHEIIDMVNHGAELDMLAPKNVHAYVLHALVGKHYEKAVVSHNDASVEFIIS